MLFLQKFLHICSRIEKQFILREGGSKHRDNHLFNLVFSFISKIDGIRIV